MTQNMGKWHNWGSGIAFSYKIAGKAGLGLEFALGSFISCTLEDLLLLSSCHF